MKKLLGEFNALTRRLGSCACWAGIEHTPRPSEGNQPSHRVEIHVHVCGVYSFQSLAHFYTFFSLQTWDATIKPLVATLEIPHTILFMYE